MDTPNLHEMTIISDNVNETLPPSDFEHSGVSTPYPTRPKRRPRMLLKNFGSGSDDEKGFPEPMERPKVSFQPKAEAIPEKYLEAEEYEEGEDVQSDDDQDNASVKSVEYAGDESADEDEAENCAGITSSIGNLIKNFVFMNVGPNISDTAQEYTHLLTHVTRENTDTPEPFGSAEDEE